MAPLGRFWIPFWRPLDFKGVPKSIIFCIKSIKGCPGRRLATKMFLGWILDAKIGGLGKPKATFRIIPVVI